MGPSQPSAKAPATHGRYAGPMGSSGFWGLFPPAPSPDPLNFSAFPKSFLPSLAHISFQEAPSSAAPFFVTKLHKTDMNVITAETSTLPASVVNTGQRMQKFLRRI